MEETLVSVLENRPDDCEIVVALACDYADPWDISEEVRFVRAPQGSGLVACVNLGVAASAGDVVHVLSVGWRATEGWTKAALAHFEDDGVGAVVPVGVSSGDRQSVVSAGVRYAVGGRRIDVAATQPRRDGRGSSAQRGAAPHGPMLEAGFWRADVLRSAGSGFTTACGDRGADVDMAVTLARGGWESVVEPAAVIVAPAAGQHSRRGAFSEGLHAERLFWRSLAGAAVVPALVMHLVEIVRHAFTRAPLGTLPMLVGRVVACLQFGAQVPRYVQLRGLVRAAAERSAAAEHEAEGRATIRMDEGHGAARGPRQRVAGPLRKSA
jgi:hypothetical protein